MLEHGKMKKMRTEGGEWGRQMDKRWIKIGRCINNLQGRDLTTETQVVSDRAVVVEERKDPLVVLLNAVRTDLLQQVTRK